MFRRIAVAAAIAAVGVLAVAGPAQAHNYLVTSTPSAGETLTELPAEFSVTTNEPMLDILDGTGFALQVRDADGLYYGDGCPTVAGSTASIPAAIGPAGEYTLLWQVVSADGHPVSGEVAFTWAGEAGVSTGTAAPAECGGNSIPSEAPTAPVEHADADLGDVLWIGGALLAVVVAAVATFVIVTRRRK